MMKILCINSNRLKNDGITNSILNYFAYMNRSDMEVDLLKTADVAPEIEGRIQEIGLKVVFTQYRKNVLRYILSTARLIRKNHYDIVHVHGSSAILSIDLLAAWLGGCKVRIAHSRNTQCDYKIIDKLLRPLFNLLCTERFACGQDAGRWLFGDRPFIVIKNGKDITKFRFDSKLRDSVREKYGWQEYTLIGHVGNFNYQKNHEFLIRVFAQLYSQNKQYRLVLMGSGESYFDAAKEQVKSLGLEDAVVFMGSITNVPEILQAMDLMLFPSRFEGLPNVVLEWQISGLPALISDKITRECKVTNLVQYLSIDQGEKVWTDAVLSMENTSEDREARSEEACVQMREAQFDIQENAKNLKKIYRRLLNK